MEGASPKTIQFGFKDYVVDDDRKKRRAVWSVVKKFHPSLQSPQRMAHDCVCLVNFIAYWLVKR